MLEQHAVWAWRLKAKMPGQGETIFDKAVAAADLSSVPGYIRDSVPEADLRQRLALEDPLVIDAATAAQESAVNDGRLAPKWANDTLFYYACMRDEKTDGK